MDKIVGVATKPPKARRDDDFVDRMSSRYTVMMLVAFSLVISISQWVGKPMQCWVPKHFTGSHTKYANSFCWVNNTYYLPFHQYIPREHEHDKRHTIYYYQWIPWILLSQAFFFWFPSLFWHSLNSKAGIDSDDILQAAYNLKSMKLEDRRENYLNQLGEQVDRFLRARGSIVNRRKSRCDCCDDCCKKCMGRKGSAYLVTIYLFSKILYLVNTVCQLFALNGLLNTEFQHFGQDYLEFYHLNNTDKYGEFMNSVTFPRITMCDFNIRILGNNQRYTVQCCLPLNLYLEKMYLVFWFWLIFLMSLTSLDIVVWFFRLILRPDRLNFVRNHLYAGKHIEDDRDHQLTGDFLDDYLGQDGAFLLRMVSHNTNSVTCAAVAGKLFEMYKDNVDNPSSIEESDDEDDEDDEDGDDDDHGDKDKKKDMEKGDSIEMELLGPGKDMTPFPSPAEHNIYSSEPSVRPPSYPSSEIERLPPPDAGAYAKEPLPV